MSATAADLATRFVEALVAVSGRAERHPNASEAWAAVAAACHGKRVALEQSRDLGGLSEAVLAGGGVVVDDVRSADIGVTGADLGIAVSGTVVLTSAPGRPRATSLVPPVHVVVLAESRLVPDMPAALAQILGVELPSSLVFVTGPSRSADIEQRMLLGAHGPCELVVHLYG